MLRDFVSGRLILSDSFLAQRRKTSSTPLCEQLGLSDAYHHPTELACSFSPRLAFIFAHASRFCEWKNETICYQPGAAAHNY
jgi:hypothetical protein